MSQLPIPAVTPIKTPLEGIGIGNTDKVNSVDFKKTLKNAINQINELQQNADQAIEKLASGELQDVHQVMIAMEKANLTFSMMMQIRNKLMQAYQEVMRMSF